MHPYFLCIGAQKAGTVWLYYNLIKHPEIWLSPLKEIHFFDYYRYHPYSFIRFFFHKRWRRQLSYRLRHRQFLNTVYNAKWNLNFFFRPHTIEWYKTIFEPGEGKKTGDITPAYSILNLQEVEYVYRHLPHAKVIFIMRNPIDRAWSQVRMWIKRGFVNIENEQQVFSKIRSRIQVSRSDYLLTLRNWETFYPKDQLFIGFFEELSECPEDFLRRLYDFLGISSAPEFMPKTLHSKYHVGLDIPMPPKVAFFLANMYYNDIVELNKRFGGYTKNWLDTAEKFMSTKPE